MIFRKWSVGILFVVLGCSFLSAEKNQEQQWMGTIDDERSISQMTILGTHNSCALHGGIYGVCQDVKLDQQLNLGVRFLDIRCKLVKGELQIFHGIMDQKMSFAQVREVCQKFLKENPTEMILMSIKYEGSKAAKKGAFGQAIKAEIKQNPALWYQSGSPFKTFPKLGLVRSKVVVVSRNHEVAGIPWRAFQIQDRYKISGEKGIETKWKFFTNHLTQLTKKKPASINFLSGTGILHPPSLNAKTLNTKLINFLQKKKGDDRSMGIIAVDFVSEKLAKAMLKHSAK